MLARSISSTTSADSDKLSPPNRPSGSLTISDS